MFFNVMLGVGVFCLLVVLTIDVAVWHLQRRSPERIPFGWIVFWRWMRWLCVPVMVIAFALGSGNPMLGLVPLMVTAVCAVAGSLRYRSELRCVNESLRLVLTHGGALPEALERLGLTLRSSLAPRLRQLAFRLRCGDSPSQAVRFARTPLAVDVVYAMAQPQKPIRENITDAEPPSLHETWPARWPVPSQIIYLTTLVVATYLVGLFANTLIFPTLFSIASEFGVPSSASSGPIGNWWTKVNLVRAAQAWMPWLMVALVIWYLAGLWVSRFPTRRRTRWVPGFGSAVRRRDRLFFLDAVASAIGARQPIDRVSVAAAEATRSRLVHEWCDQIAGRVSQGQSTAIALKGAGLISVGESRWLEAAERNGNLQQSLIHLVTDARRQQRDLWQHRLSWLVPVVVCLAGSYVLLHALVLFQFLTDLVVHAS
ncbi:MAG: type II secretion system F family protein [Planctomycetota bacterium]